MSVIGNILWFILGGFVLGLAWLVTGLIFCITVIGIPFGVQCFKIGAFAFFPFGKRVEFGQKTSSLLLNIIWLLFFGWELALSSFLMGILLYITIIGIPFGRQYLKLAKISLMPFGVEIY